MLIEEAFVGRAAALGDEEEFVFVARLGVEVDLGRQIVAGVDLLIHRQRRDLAVAQIGLGKGAPDPFGERRRIVGAGPHHPLALLAHDDRGAGVLAHRQDLAGGDIGVLQQVEGDEPVVGRGFGVVEDGAQLRQMAGPQQVLAIDKGLLREQRQCLGRNFDDALAVELGEPDMIAGQLFVGRIILAQREKFVECRLAHTGPSNA